MRILAAVALLGVIGCSQTTAADTGHHITVGGVRRTWSEYRPPHLPAGPVPVVVMFHGLNAIPGDMLNPIGMAAEADRDGFVVALPQGLNRAWNAGSCCGNSTSDDITFVLQMVSSMVARKVADPTRVYAAGFSNGAMLAYRVACQLSTAFAGVAVVEGTMTAPCPNHPPINLLVVHQLGDKIVPYSGTSSPIPSLGVTAPLVSVPDSIIKFEKSEGCLTPNLVSGLPKAVVDCPGGVRVELDAIPGGSHVWPADATPELVSFFGLH